MDLDDGAGPSVFIHSARKPLMSLVFCPDIFNEVCPGKIIKGEVSPGREVGREGAEIYYI